jgi:hypothetical protein
MILKYLRVAGVQSITACLAIVVLAVDALDGRHVGLTFCAYDLETSAE